MIIVEVGTISLSCGFPNGSSRALGRINFEFLIYTKKCIKI